MGPKALDDPKPSQFPLGPSVVTEPVRPTWSDVWIVASCTRWLKQTMRCSRIEK